MRELAVSEGGTLEGSRQEPLVDLTVPSVRPRLDVGDMTVRVSIRETLKINTQREP